MTCSFSKDFSSSGYTAVENTFITTYLPLSKGNSAKVYLYGLFLCQNPAFDQPIESICDTLGIEKQELLDCFSFWEDFGLVDIISKDPLNVIYLPIKASFGHKAIKYNPEKYTEFSKSLQALISTRMISTNEYSEYFLVMEERHIKPEAMLMIIKYSISRAGENVNKNYILAVVNDFSNKGLVTVEKIDEYLKDYSMNSAIIIEIMRTLSIKKNPEMADLELYKKWTEDLNFDKDTIKFSASKLKKGSMQKLDEFLLELYKAKCFDKTSIEEYTKRKAGIFNLTVKINRALSIFVEVLEPEINNYVSKWLSFGFTEDALILVANYLFKSNKNTLNDMDELIDALRKQGAITISSVSDYFDSLIKTDEFIKKMLITAGINHQPTPWDRENVAIWKSWNFTEEMILESAKLSAGKSSPIAYMNGILSNWKANNVYTIDSVSEKTEVKDNSQEEYNREYERRRAVANLRAQKNTSKALEIEGFSAVYGRLYGIEKDLAFAEINQNIDALKCLEAEKKELQIKADTMLKTIGLDFSDLSPKYACEKCKDTGYVGTHRCDCFDKKIK